MSAFWEYLEAEGEKPDDKLKNYERDESWFVFNLLLFRQGFMGEAGHQLSETFLERSTHDYDPLAILLPPKNKAIGDAAFFVASFLCFFIAKPPSYQKEIAALKEQFVHGFASDRSRRQQLAEVVRPAFAEIPIIQRGDPWPYGSLEELIKPDWLLATAGDNPPWKRTG